MTQKNSLRKVQEHSLGHIDVSLHDTYKHKTSKVGSEMHKDLKAKLKQEIESLLTRQKKNPASKKRNDKGGSEGQRRSKRGRGGGLK
jgi:hypothetical protein